jgi:hypothetical protein
MSVFAWLDYDEAERRRMQEAIELFRESDTIDELGIGSVRDAFSNLLFPGTSVLQTRARYLLFIPWVYRRLERAHLGSNEVTAAARRDEVRLIFALLEGGEERDVIGGRARERLIRLPSEAYWSGLGILGMRLFPGTRAQYHRSFDAFRAAQREAPRDPHRSDADEPVGAWAHLNWDPALDALEPQDFLVRTDFTLSAEEGSYLRDRIVARVPESLLAFLLARSPAEHVGFPWLHPDVGELPASLAAELELARVLSQVMWGAALLYNLLLAEMTSQVELAESYRERIRRWAAALPAVGDGWSWAGFWETASRGNPHLVRTRRTQRFVEEWFGVARALGEGVAGDERARGLISARERQVKGGQARLHSLSARERWSGASGAGQITFRWAVVERIVSDIQGALRATGVTDARA